MAYPPTPWSIWLVPGGFVSLCLWASLSGCGSLATDPPTQSSLEPSAAPTAVETPDLIYEDITLTELRSEGQPLWQIQARFARYEQEQGMGNAELDQVQGEFYDAENHPIRVQARAGAIYPEVPRLELREEVEVESSFHQVRVNADQVEWLPESDQLRAQGNVIVRSLPPTSGESDSSAPEDLTVTDLEATADQLIFDLAQNRLSLTNSGESAPVQVTATSPPLDLEALTVAWDLEAQQLTAEGEVNGIHRPRQIQLTGERLISPLTTPQIAVVGQAEALGLETQQQITADQLLWDTTTPIIEAQGNVFYRQPSQDLSLRGTSGTLNWETQTAAVQGGATTTQLRVP